MKYIHVVLLGLVFALCSGCATKKVQLDDPLGFIENLDQQVQEGLAPLEDCEEYNLGVAQINYQIFQIASQACAAKQQQETDDPFFRPRAFVKCVAAALKLHAVDPKDCDKGTK